MTGVGETTTLTCRCGTQSCEHVRTGNVGETARATGFSFVWDIRNGLSPCWLCPACFEKVASAWSAIVELVGHDMISMTSVLRQHTRRAQ
jgi:hypothetical protein